MQGSAGYGRPPSILFRGTSPFKIVGRYGRPFPAGPLGSGLNLAGISPYTPPAPRFSCPKQIIVPLDMHAEVQLPQTDYCPTVQLPQTDYCRGYACECTGAQ